MVSPLLRTSAIVGPQLKLCGAAQSVKVPSVFLIAGGDRLVTTISLRAHIGGITPSLPKRTAPLVREPSD
jgi:hypothetical protein